MLNLVAGRKVVVFSGYKSSDAGPREHLGSGSFYMLLHLGDEVNNSIHLLEF